MNRSIASVLGLIYVLSELGLAFKKRAKVEVTRDGDRGSLRLIWIVIVPSVTLAFNIAYVLPAAGMDAAPTLTVNVAIAADHRVIDTGPYRFVRHPSYTGALMAFLGLAFCLANWASLVVLMVPVFLVFLRRMRVEEAALLQAIGDRYRDYMNRTKRLIPAIY